MTFLSVLISRTGLVTGVKERERVFFLQNNRTSVKKKERVDSEGESRENGMVDSAEERMTPLLRYCILVVMAALFLANFVQLPRSVKEPPASSDKVHTQKDIGIDKRESAAIFVRRRRVFRQEPLWMKLPSISQLP